MSVYAQLDLHGEHMCIPVCHQSPSAWTRQARPPVRAHPPWHHSCLRLLVRIGRVVELDNPKLAVDAVNTVVNLRLID